MTTFAHYLKSFCLLVLMLALGCWQDFGGVCQDPQGNLCDACAIEPVTQRIVCVAGSGLAARPDEEILPPEEPEPVPELEPEPEPQERQFEPDDMDGDGIVNDADAFPQDPLRCVDGDADGCDDCASGTHTTAADGPDSDGDGQCDASDPCAEGVCACEAWALDEMESLDTPFGLAADRGVILLDDAGMHLDQWEIVGPGWLLEPVVEEVLPADRPTLRTLPHRTSVVWSGSQDGVLATAEDAPIAMQELLSDEGDFFTAMTMDLRLAGALPARRVHGVWHIATDDGLGMALGIDLRPGLAPALVWRIGPEGGRVVLPPEARAALFYGPFLLRFVLGPGGILLAVNHTPVWVGARPPPWLPDQGRLFVGSDGGLLVPWLENDDSTPVGVSMLEGALLQWIWNPAAIQGEFVATAVEHLFQRSTRQGYGDCPPHSLPE